MLNYLPIVPKVRYRANNDNFHHDLVPKGNPFSEDGDFYKVRQI